MLAGLPYFPHRPPVLRGVWGSGPQGGMGAVLPVQGDATLSRAASPTRYPSPPQSPHHPSSLALGRGARYLAQHLPPQQPARCIISFSLGGGRYCVYPPPRPPHTPGHPQPCWQSIPMGGLEECWGVSRAAGGATTHQEGTTPRGGCP